MVFADLMRGAVAVAGASAAAVGTASGPAVRAAARSAVGTSDAAVGSAVGAAIRASADAAVGTSDAAVVTAGAAVGRLAEMVFAEPSGRTLGVILAARRSAAHGRRGRTGPAAAGRAGRALAVVVAAAADRAVACAARESRDREQQRRVQISHRVLLHSQFHIRKVEPVAPPTKAQSRP